MWRLAKKPASHEELFLERYPELISWSMQITGHDPNKAADLVHDAYIQWILVRPDLASIRNLDGYLYGMLRNMHSAEMRRSARASGTSLSVIEYDSALVSLRRVSDELQISLIQDQLRAVCDYACLRKETSKAGSLLLLRFFHGYYPGEAARIAAIRRVTVDSWLRIARNEARLYLENPEALKFLEVDIKTKRSFYCEQDELDFLDQISQRISHSCRGRCLSDRELRAAYTRAESEALDCESLAHISSCHVCLTKAAKILNLPRKDNRYPPDWLGRDPQSGEKSGKKSRQNQRGPHTVRMQLDDVIEHRPKELHLAVNGFTVGTQKVISERIEHSLKVSLLEQIGLVEVLSEQGIRLLCLYVEAPPQGTIEQSARVYLSDDRTLGLTLDFRDEWPNLELTYSDPHFSEVASDPEVIPARGRLLLSEPEFSPAPQRENPLSRLFSLLRNTPNGEHIWLRRALIGVLVAVLAVALFVIRKPAIAPLPAEILVQAQSLEKSLIPAGQISHRRISYEEHSNSVSPKRHTVEVWQTANGNRARRLFDDKGTLVAGAWQDDAGSSQNVLYHHGSKLKLPPLAKPKNQPSLDHLWLLDPSAVSFSALVEGMESEGVRTVDNHYVLSYRQNTTSGSSQELAPLLTRAMLVVDRSTLRAVSEVLVFGRDDDRREFIFTELSFETLATSDVDQKVFQPDAELLAPVESTAPKSEVNVSIAKPAPPATVLPPTAAELASLEVDVLYLLDQINANSGEQIEVRRVPGKELVVEAIVESDKRKTELLHALAAVAGNPLVKMDVVTLEEALRRQTDPQFGPTSTDRVVITSDRILVYDELRRYLEREKGDGNSSSPEIEDEIRRFSSLMIDQSRQALLHAFTLKHLVERFSPIDLRLLDEVSRRKLHDMIRAHARGFRQNASILRRDLTPAFPHAETNEADTVASLNDDAAMAEAVRSLLNFASATDEAISRAFTISPDPRPALNTPGTIIFWRTLNRAETLAAALERIP